MKRSLGLLLCAAVQARAADSVCYGSVTEGRIEGAVALAQKGPNFVTYSDSPITAGRQFVHAKVAEIVLAAYARVHAQNPQVRYMVGESGLEKGGRFEPHRSHQNGLSVDFFVPVRDATGQPVVLPTALNNRFGYDIEFDAEGRYANYKIDFAALAEHLVALQRAAAERHVKIIQVILDPDYVRRVLATVHGPYLRRHLNFMRAKPWVRHDEHYHVDFDVPCQPLMSKSLPPLTPDQVPPGGAHPTKES